MRSSTIKVQEGPGVAQAGRNGTNRDPAAPSAVPTTDPNASPKLRYVSISRIHMFLRCPRQFYYRYIRGEKSPPTGPMTFGKAVHAAIEFNYGQKIRTKRDLPLPQVQHHLEEKFRKFDPDTRWKDDAERDSLKASAGNLVKLYHETVAPNIQPFMVEEEFEVHLDGLPLPLRGIIDLVDTNGIIVDHKTAGQKPNADKIEREIRPQLMGYALAYESVTGSPPRGLRADFLVRTKVPQFFSYPIEVTTAQLKGFVRLLFAVTEQIADCIETDRWTPNPYNFTCSEKGCAFWKTCRKEWLG